jgi:hypothetical protein
MNTLVCIAQSSIIQLTQSLVYNLAGGWRKAHPLPSDKGRFGNFNLLFQENQQIVKDILDDNGSISIASLKESADQQLLTKLRSLYHSCMDEDTLDQLGEGPLKDFVGHVKKLYRGESTGVAYPDDDDKKRGGLTAALAFLHSRGLKTVLRLKGIVFTHAATQVFLASSNSVSRVMPLSTQIS